MPSLLAYFQVYQANEDRNGVIINRLIQPIEARFVRIYPETWHGHISMRVELHGCEIRSGKVILFKMGLRLPNECQNKRLLEVQVPFLLVNNVNVIE